jgi:hypothetical protein
MLRVIGFACALALGAAAVHAEEDRADYSRAQAKLTEQLNTVISEGVELEKKPAPPAKPEEPAGEPAPGERHASR